MENKAEIIKDEVIQDEVLDNVAGGVGICIPARDGNMEKLTAKEIDRRWEIVKERQGWEFKNRTLGQKDKELELKAKKMWIDFGMDVFKSGSEIAKLLMGGGAGGAGGADGA